MDKFNPDSECFNYYFRYESGRLYWKVKPSRNRDIGDSACNECSHGYRRVILGNKQYKAHRVIFCMFSGYMPDYIDHINMDRQDNRIENLRDATSSLNNHNKRTRADNTSGVKGVSWSKSVKKWHARISINKKTVFSKYFEDIGVAECEINNQRKLLKLPQPRPTN